MGRPPCCDKVGIKKGPWTPEEDIILVSYIQEHGPGNWRSVPTNTGLLRCSKSCRLRWTNYLRPGIKRGNFTPHEEGMIIHLQALLGNKWAAIASYLPQRTDNDIKNYWNTHLKKKLKKFQSNLDSNMTQDSLTRSQFVSKSFYDRRSLDCLITTTTSTSTTPATPSSTLKLTQASTTTYASSTENISRLLEGWMTSPLKSSIATSMDHDHGLLHEKLDKIGNNIVVDNIVDQKSTNSLQCYRPKVEQDLEQEGDIGAGSGENEIISHDHEFESILSFENLKNVSWDHMSTCESNICGSRNNNTTTRGSSYENSSIDKDHKKETKKQKFDGGGTANIQPSPPPPAPLSFLEKWLLDESSCGVGSHVEDAMELSTLF